MKRLIRSAAVQSALVRMGAWYLWVALATKRWRMEGLDNLAACRAGAPTIIAFWHEMLPLMPAVLMASRRMPDFRARPVHVLVSQHRDGRLIGDLVRFFGFEPVLGSSSKGGVAAFRSLASLLRGDGMVGITPDGPRGPARQAAAGVAQLAAMSGAPIVVIGAAASNSRRTGSWDRMIAPFPFGRGVIVCRPPIHVPRDGWMDALPAIAAEMTLAAEEADRLCRA